MSAKSNIGGNIARPYAQALFELAQEEGKLSEWDDQLQLVASITSDNAITELSNSPKVTAEQLSDLIIGVCGDQLSEGGRNLVKLLIKNDRISSMTAIADAFSARKAEAEKVVEAEMITAVSIDEAQQKQFESALEKKLGRSVNLEFGVDENLIGGAVIRSGDWVVDGSVKSQLEQLVGALGN